MSMRGVFFTYFKQCILLICFITITKGYAQEVKAVVDTSQIKIGEKITYTLTVKTDSASQVILPEGQTFLPLEVIEESAPDTIISQAKLTYIKKYGLTQFDSGTYTLPKQRVLINNKNWFTDSIAIKVLNVPVDTTKQKLYDIKPIVAVQKSYSGLLKQLLIWFLVLLAVGALVYWFVFRKKPLTEEEKIAQLPPYERALQELENLEHSKYLIQSEYKTYYSQLTNIVRRYLEDEVHIAALESTTQQLIDRLQLLKESGELSLDDQTIIQFKKVLETADLVKFAKSEPDTKTAENDKTTIQNIIVKTKEALPEPSEEELLEEEAYKEALRKAQKRKKIKFALLTAAAVLLVSAGVAIAVFGGKTVKDTVFRHPSKVLLNKDWVASDYGYPPVFIETPQVLVRGKLNNPKKENELSSYAVFNYAHSKNIIQVTVKSLLFKTQDQDAPFENEINFALQQLSEQGAKNLLTKQEEFTSKSGIKGIKTYGSGSFKKPSKEQWQRGKYAIVTFGGKGFIQQIIVVWPDNDEYADKIADRILESIDVKTEI